MSQHNERTRARHISYRACMYFQRFERCVTPPTLNEKRINNTCIYVTKRCTCALQYICVSVCGVCSTIRSVYVFAWIQPLNVCGMYTTFLLPSYIILWSYIISRCVRIQTHTAYMRTEKRVELAHISSHYVKGTQKYWKQLRCLCAGADIYFLLFSPTSNAHRDSRWRQCARPPSCVMSDFSVTMCVCVWCSEARTLVATTLSLVIQHDRVAASTQRNKCVKY